MGSSWFLEFFGNFSRTSLQLFCRMSTLKEEHHDIQLIGGKLRPFIEWSINDILGPLSRGSVGQKSLTDSSLSCIWWIQCQTLISISPFLMCDLTKWSRSQDASWASSLWNMKLILGTFSYSSGDYCYRLGEHLQRCRCPSSHLERRRVPYLITRWFARAGNMISWFHGNLRGVPPGCHPPGNKALALLRYY